MAQAACKAEVRHRLAQAACKAEVRHRLAQAACKAGARRRMAQAACKAGARRRMAQAACTAGARYRLAQAAYKAGARRKMAPAACTAGVQHRLAQAAYKAGARRNLAQAACRAGAQGQSMIAWQVEHMAGDWCTVDHKQPVDGKSYHTDSFVDRRLEPSIRRSQEHRRNESLRLYIAGCLHIVAAAGRKLACHIHAVDASWRKETRKVYRSCQRRGRFWCR